ncbi:MAG: MarC family protein [Intrasporangium sp.]|uniref:MarC family protein n=1 Tax=Intrasporangium sp. TaxID=1925024 RepID=UPI003F7FA94C
MSGFDLTIFLSTFITLIVILDPPGIVPVFLALTGSLTPAQRNNAALRAAGVAVLVIAMFAIFGQQILDYLHISIAALQAAGGLLLLLIALQLLMGRESDAQADVGVNVAMVPLGTPMLAGPGAIVATMVAVRGASGLGGYLSVGAALLAAIVVVFLAMRFAGLVRRLLGESGTMLLTRIAGLLLSAIAVEMIAGSIRAFVSTAS